LSVTTAGKVIPGLAPVDDSKSKSALKRGRKVKDAGDVKNKEEAARVCEEERSSRTQPPSLGKENWKRSEPAKLNNSSKLRV
jgi:hypothetical protein